MQKEVLSENRVFQVAEQTIKEKYNEIYFYDLLSLVIVVYKVIKSSSDLVDKDKETMNERYAHKSCSEY